MGFRIAVITDIHDAMSCPIPARRGEFGRVFLQWTVQRLNKWIRPDVVVLLGDLIDKAEADDAESRLRELRRIVDTIDVPTIAIPGNHDPKPDDFYKVFDRPDDVVDVNGVRFLPFVDPEEPGFNAIRTPKDMDRMRRAREDGHDGAIVTLQHVPVLPPGKTNCRYTYTNIEEIIRVMDEQGITLALGGHHHRGTPLVRQGKSAYYCAPALCEAPFVFTLINLEGQEVRVQQHTLQGLVESDLANE